MKKKIAVILAALVCLLMAGCSNAYAQAEYDSPEKIASSGDHYSKIRSVQTTIDGGFRLTVGSFDGRETLWTETRKDSQTAEGTLLLTLTHGQAKLVHVDEAGTVTTLLECTPQTASDEPVTVTVPMQPGRNKLKLVGYDCKNLKCEFVFGEP